VDDRRQDDRRQQPRRNEDGGNDTIRVETARLDKVMNLVGELVLARNTMQRQLNNLETRRVIEDLENGAMIFSTMELVSRVTQDLQMSVLSTRMQPIKKVFDKIPRQVRELKTQLAKEVNLIVEGEMTEVDKSLVEELADPMVHMIRNALDHGLESPAERSAVGKHPEGTLVVRAFYEGNNVVIQVQEDGKGIDPEKIKQVAIKKGVVSEDAARVMSDAEAIRLIMAPGFSTADKITDVSGRGVGMDVVNTKILNLQGSIEIRSELGMGTCFSIYMPLTLAIVNALIVGAKREGFAIPIGDIAEVIKFDSQVVHHVNDQDVIELRGESLPLFYLDKLTRAMLPQADSAQIEVKDDSAIGDNIQKGFVVVVREGSGSMGLVVDALLGQEEVVVKPVTGMFEFNKAISGATITGDGKVHMILDVPYLMKDLSGTIAR
jgi:two-component system chemotaxis sensor kinase CheA